jgi:hypothetical protein
MVYLQVKENSERAKIFLELIKAMDFVEIIEKAKIPNLATKKAIQEARNSKLVRARNVKDLLKKLNT